MRALSTTGLLLLVSVTLLAARPAAADTCTWNGSSGAWTDAARWSCGHVPSGIDTAVIASGTVTLGTSLSVAALQLSGGTLASGGTLTLTGTASSWTGGTMTGAGTTRVAPGAALALSGGPLTLRRRLRVEGDATWSVDAGQPMLGGAGEIVVGGGGEMRVTSTLVPNPLPPGLTVAPALTVEAGGLFVSDARRKLTFSGVITSAGTIHSAYQSLASSAQYTGTGLFFTGGGTLGGEVVSTNTVQFDAGTYALLNGLRIRQSEPFCGVCHTTTVDGATFVAHGTVSVENLYMRTGVIEGEGDLVASVASFVGGVLRGTGDLRATGFVFFDGSFSLERETRVESGGYLGWTWGFAGGPGPFAAAPGSVTVQSGAVVSLDAHDDGTIDIPFAIEAGATLGLIARGPSVVSVVSLPQLYANSGTILLNAEPSSDVVLRPGSPFVNTGAVEGMGGLDLAGSAFSNTGTVEPYVVVTTNSGQTTTRVPAVLTVEGDYTNATLRLDLNAPPLSNPSGPVAPFDRLLISGTGQLGGVLDLAAVGVPPLSNDTLVVVTCAGGCTGTFDTVVKPVGFDLDVVYLADRVLVVDRYTPPLVNCTWDGSNGPWSEASRWSCGHVPGPPDRAIIQQGRADVNADVSVGALTLRQNGQIGGAATLTLLGASTWSGGFMNAGGVTVVGPDATLTLPGEGGGVAWVGRRVEVAGAVEWTGGGMNPGWAGNGYGPVVVRDGGVFTSRVTGVTAGVPVVVEPGGEFVHDAPGTLVLGWGLSNAGTVRVLQGTLTPQSSPGPDLHGGLFDTAEGAQLRFQSSESRFGTGTAFTGEGLVVTVGGTFRLDADVTIPHFRYENGNLTGAGSLTVGEAMTWVGGVAHPGGPIVVPAGATLDVPSSPGAVWLGRPLDVAGTMQWDAAGGPFIYGYAGSGYGPITLQDGSTFTVTGAATSGYDLHVPVFVEPGAALVRNGTGTVVLNGAVTNDGTVRVSTGGLRPTEGFMQRGRMEGAGTLDVGGLSWTNTGTFAPGASPGVLTVAGTYTNRVLAVELGGTTPGTGHDQLVVTGMATLADTLRLSLVGSYAPAVGDAYTILTAGSLAGTFTSVEAPTGVAVTVTYTATSVVVTVTDNATLTVVRTLPTAAVVVPAGGSTFSIRHTITNTGSTPETLDTWLALTQPGGVTVLAGGPEVLTLAAGANSKRKKTIKLGEGSAPGRYVLTRFVGTYPDGAVASESYSFAKAGPFTFPESLPDAVAAVEDEVDEGLLVVAEEGGVGTAAVAAPAATGLGLPYPNPSAGQTTVPFDAAAAVGVRVVVYDVLGRTVAVLVDGERAAGRYEATLDAGMLAEGTYVVRMAAGGSTFTRRVTVLR